MAKKRPQSSSAYPSPEELPQLIARRRQLAEQIMVGIVLQAEDQRAADRLLDEILRTYGRAEVTRMTTRVLANLERPEDSAVEAEQLYNVYVASWRRFGGERPLLSLEEHRRLRDERADLIGKEMFEEQTLSPEEQRRVDELGELIFAEPHLWDDLVPPNPPASVAPQGAPPPARERPGRNDPCWCGSGRKYKQCHLRADEESGL